MANKRWAIRPSRQVLVAAAAGILLLVGSFAHDQWSHYHEELAQAERSVRGAASLLAEHTARTFDAAESALRAVARVREDAAREGYDAATVHGLLKAIHGGSPVFRAIGWVDADGNRVASSLFLDPPPLNVADQEQFRALRDDDTAKRRLYIASPTRSRLLDGWILSVSLRMDGPDGSFDGIAGGVVDPEYFARVYRSIDLGPHDVVSLFRGDGTILVRKPQDESLLGTTLAGRRFMTEVVPSAPVGAFHAHGLSDGASRVIGYATAQDDRFIVTVAARHDDVLRAFWHSFSLVGLRMTLIIVAFAVGTWLLVRQVRRGEQLAADLRYSESRFRDFAASSGDWFWETDAQHRFVWMSDSVEAATGVPAAWHYGRSRMDMAAPAGISADTWMAHRNTLRQQWPFRDFEYVRRGPSGDRWLRVNGVPVFNDDGSFRGYRGSGRDISDLRRAEQRLRDAVESLPAGFMIFDADDRLTYVNGHTSDVMPELADHYRIGDTFEQILRRCVDAGAVPAASEDSERWIGERLRRHLAATGSTVVSFGGRVVDVIERRTSEGGIMVLRFDITDREQARQAAQQAREAADTANRAKSEFLSSMSHELRTPLNAIIGFGQVLKLDRGNRLAADQQAYCDHIVNSGEHLLNLVNEVLDLAVVEAGRLRLSLEPVGVADVLRHAVTTMAAVADRGAIQVAPVPDTGALTVQADAQRLRQVLLNLLSNAVKYNRPGGSVSFSAEAVDGGRVRIAVTDTGPGIAPADHGRMFAPFQRLGAEFTKVEGTGIGLALSKRLIEAMDGRIGVTSEPGQGSTFWVELPVASTAPRAAAEPLLPQRAPLAAAGGYSLLYVEDNPLNVSLMEYLLETLPNVTMHAAPSGPIGLELARAQRPDVIVLDLNLPEMDGFQVLERLQGDPQTADIPVIALTASAMPHDVRRGMAAGFFGYLTKPLKFDEFLACVDAALRQRPAAPRPVAAGDPGDDTVQVRHGVD